MYYKNDEEYIQSHLGYDKFVIWICVGALIGVGIYLLTNHHVIQVTLSHAVRHAISVFGLLLGLYLFQKTNMYERLVDKSRDNLRKSLEKHRKKIAEKKSEMIAKNIKATHLVYKCVGIIVCWFMGMVVDSAIPLNDWLASSFVIGAIGSFILLRSNYFKTLLENYKKSAANYYEQRALYPE